MFKLLTGSEGSWSSNLHSNLTHATLSVMILCPVTQGGKLLLWTEIYPTDFQTRWTVLPYKLFDSSLTTEGAQKMKIIEFRPPNCLSNKRIL